MNPLTKLVRKFLIKEIISKSGELHFQRYHLLSTKWGDLYLHRIFKSDEEKHMHDHPYDFKSLIIKGSYKEYYAVGPAWGNVKEKIFKLFNVNKHEHDTVHKIEIIKGPVWTLFFASKKRYVWGFQTEIGFIEHDRYRVLKNNGYWKNEF